MKTPTSLGMRFNSGIGARHQRRSAHRRLGSRGRLAANGCLAHEPRRWHARIAATLAASRCVHAIAEGPTDPDAVETHHGPVPAALAALADGELAGLCDAIHELHLIAPALLSWIGRFTKWEAIRRAGRGSSPAMPDAAIPAGEDAGSIVGAMMMRYKFSQAPVHDGGAIAALFDAVFGELVGRYSVRQ